MKRIITFILMSLILQNAALAVPTQSTNAFPLDIDAGVIPKGGGTPSGGGGSSSSGLSGGAVTAITLGSIGGVALLGGLAWFLKPYWAKGMTSGAAAGLDCPILAMCLDDKTVETIMTKYSNNPLLLKALGQDKIRECPCSKYILVPDTEICSNTFNTIIFKIPTEMKNQQGSIKVRITQVSNPLKGEELDTKMYIKEDSAPTDEAYKKGEIRLQNAKTDKERGIIIKNGQINSEDIKNSSTAALIVSNSPNVLSKTKTAAQKYAFVIEFSK